MQCKEDIPLNFLKFTYNGNRDSTPIPVISLLNLIVVFRPAFRLAITMPFRVEIRLLFSGVSCDRMYHNKNYSIDRKDDDANINNKNFPK